MGKLALARGAPEQMRDSEFDYCTARAAVAKLVRWCSAARSIAVGGVAYSVTCCVVPPVSLRVAAAIRISIGSPSANVASTVLPSVQLPAPVAWTCDRSFRTSRFLATP